jgi:hypothetical protein
LVADLEDGKLDCKNIVLKRSFNVVLVDLDLARELEANGKVECEWENRSLSQITHIGNLRYLK